MTDHSTRPGGDNRDAFGRWIRQNPRKTVLIGMGILLVLALIRGFTGEDTASLMQRTSDATAYFALVQETEAAYYDDNGRYTESVAELTALEPRITDQPPDTTLELTTEGDGKIVTLSLEGLTVRFSVDLRAGEAGPVDCEIKAANVGSCPR